MSKIILGILSLTLSSCVALQPKADFAPTKIGETLAVRTQPDDIELFRSQSPTKKYVEIGSVSSCCLRMEKSVELLRKSASAHGGDALIGLDATADGLVMATVIRYQ